MSKFLFFITTFFTTTLVFSQQVTPVAGYDGCGFLDGPALPAEFSGPWGLCADPTGTIIYIADSYNNKIRKIDLTTGLVSTIAGSTEGFADGVGTAAQFFRPIGVCLDSNGFLYVTDALNHKIRKIDLSTDTVTTFAGSTQGYVNGMGTTAKFNNPSGICIDSNNSIYVSESSGNRIRKISQSGLVNNLAGNGTAGFADGNGTNARFYAPHGICIGSLNYIYVVDLVNFKIRKISPSGSVSTIAGTGEFGYEDGSTTTAKLGSIEDICYDNSGNFYITDNYFDNHTIRKIDLNTNTVSTFFDISVHAPSAKGICFKNNTIYVTSFGSCKIFKITDVLSTENFEKEKIQLVPNPATNSFTVNTSTSKVLIYNLMGQLIQEFKGNLESSYNYNIQDLSNGTYLVKIIDHDNNEKILKLIKE